MDYLETQCPKLIYKNKIIITNEQLYQQLTDYLKYYGLTFHKIPKVINGYYENIDDFNQNHTIVFLNKETLKAWQYDQSEIKIQNHLLPYMSYPYLYQHLSQIYIKKE